QGVITPAKYSKSHALTASSETGRAVRRRPNRPPADTTPLKHWPLRNATGLALGPSRLPYFSVPLRFSGSGTYWASRLWQVETSYRSPPIWLHCYPKQPAVGRPREPVLPATMARSDGFLHYSV